MKYVSKHGKSRHRKSFKVKRIILKGFTYLMGIIFLFSICCLDSENFYIPLITMIISGAWLYFIAWINGWTYH